MAIDRPFKVCLMGTSLDSGNRGVLALATSAAKLAMESCPDARISFFIGAKAPKRHTLHVGGAPIDVDVFNFRLTPRAGLRENLVFMLAASVLYRALPLGAVRRSVLAIPALRMLSEADFVGDIRGGDSFSDIYGMRRFLTGCMPDLICLLLGKDLVMLPQTYGPFRSSLSRSISKAILRRCRRVLARDRESVQVASRMIGGKGPDPALCPDVALVLDSSPPDPGLSRVILGDGEGRRSRPVIGINVNGLMYNGGYTRANMFGLKMDYRAFIGRLMESLLTKTEARLLLVPHTYGPRGSVNSDPDACENALGGLAKELRDRVVLIGDEYGPSEIKGIIGLCDFFIGSRMHACIAALSQGIPTAGVAYSRKFQGVFDSVGVGHLVLDARELTTEEAVDRVVRMFGDREAEAAGIEVSVSSARESLRRTFADMFQDAGRPFPGTKAS